MYFAGGEPEVQGALDAALAFWDDLKGVVRQSMIATVESEVADINPASGEIENAYVGVGGTVQGTDAGDTLPTATQGLLRLTTGQYVGGRQIRGRLFLPGPTETSSTGGVPVPTYLNTALAAGLGLVNDGATQLVCWSRKNGAAFPVTSASIWQQWAVLRSRRQ